MYRTFKKYMQPGTKECCPYTTSDCSYRTVDDEEATFYVYFHWPTISTNRYTIKCTTGGGLNIMGEHQNHYAVCVDAKGVATQVAITPSASTYW
ncbi:hypothetical protein BDF21DRAFT_345005 [Thamnidium elegans]|nr:hypothetical protein BDF21DRAFT_345005 [Thamnidium elegans]